MDRDDLNIPRECGDCRKFDSFREMCEENGSKVTRNTRAHKCDDFVHRNLRVQMARNTRQSTQWEDTDPFIPVK